MRDGEKQRETFLTYFEENTKPCDDDNIILFCNKLCIFVEYLNVEFID